MLTLGVGSFTITAQNSNVPYFTSGTDFSFPNLARKTIVPSFHRTEKSKSIVQITAQNNTCGRLWIPGQGFEKKFSLLADSTVLVTLPDDTIRRDTNSDVGIFIKTTYPVQVVFATDVGLLDSSKAGGFFAPLTDSINTEATAITPIVRASDQYFLNIPNIPNEFHPFEAWHQLWVHAPMEAISVEIELKNAPLSYIISPNVPFLQSIPFGYCFYGVTAGLTILPPRPALEGSSFFELDNKDFLMFGGCQHVTYGNCMDISPFSTLGSNRKLTFDQSKPLTFGDTMHMAAQILNHYPNLYSILALNDSTSIYLNGTFLALLNSGEQIDTCATEALIITSTRPTLLTLTRSAIGTDFPGLHPSSSSNSPFSITMPGSNELMKRSILKPFSESYKNTYVVALFTKSGDTSNFTLNGQTLPFGNWKTFAARPGWAWTQIEISDKTHILESSGEGFIGYHYSYAKKRPNYYFYPSYGYCLIESKAVTEDSLQFYIKTENTSKQILKNFHESICVGDSVQLFANAARHTSWHWNFGDGNDTLQQVGNTSGKPISHTYTNPGQYWLFVTDTSGCATGDSVRIEVLPAPAPSFTYTAFETCEEGSKIELHNSSTGASSYSWSLPEGISNEESPSFFYSGSEPFKISLIAKHNNCSSSPITKIINPQTDIFTDTKIPNVFTPNNDGLNDCFGVNNLIGKYAECFELSIFNRWGSMVWSTTNPNGCWNGLTDNKPNASGTYYYILKVANSDYKGHLYLSR